MFLLLVCKFSINNTRSHVYIYSQIKTCHVGHVILYNFYKIFLDFLTILKKRKKQIFREVDFQTIKHDYDRIELRSVKQHNYMLKYIFN